MIQTPVSHSYWLLDASALTPAEIDMLRQLAQPHWLYAHIHDDRAASVGPVLLEMHAGAAPLIQTLQGDETRAWALSSLHTEADLDSLTRHLTALCYVHTEDGQRYFLRYADSRCLVALWPVLSQTQQAALLGPVRCWSYSDRQGQAQNIRLDEAQTADAPLGTTGHLRLQDKQLGHLLERCLPDQLLHSVLEQQPGIGPGLSSWQRYACAQRVCDWLAAHAEERYPVQLATLALIMMRTKPDWDDAQWADALLASHQAGIQACG